MKNSVSLERYRYRRPLFVLHSSVVIVSGSQIRTEDRLHSITVIGSGLNVDVFKRAHVKCESRGGGARDTRRVNCVFFFLLEFFYNGYSIRYTTTGKQFEMELWLWDCPILMYSI